MSSEKFIGIFDSGLGGLTVVKQIWSQLSSENIIYLGDTARVPYGTKSVETIQKYSIQNSLFLLQNQVKAIVIACNTASAFAIKNLQHLFQVPVLGVIVPGAQAALSISQTQKIGVFGTKGTIRSCAYQQEIQFQSPNAQVFSQACPLLVPLVEEGWFDHETTREIISIYWQELLKQSKNIDSLILGCTHYPLLKEVIQKVVGPKVQLIDSAVATAESLQVLLSENDLLNPSADFGKTKFCVTDDPKGFKKSAELFLKKEISEVEKVFVE